MEIMKLTIKEDFHRVMAFFLFSYHKITLFEKKYDIKDVRGWQFLTMKAAEILCIVCLPPEKHIS